MEKLTIHFNLRETGNAYKETMSRAWSLTTVLARHSLPAFASKLSATMVCDDPLKFVRDKG